MAQIGCMQGTVVKHVGAHPRRDNAAGIDDGCGPPLAEVATRVSPGKHCALLVDQAGWHISQRLIGPANITIVKLPPKCPELNPIENVWQFMRDNWLSNRVFGSYTAIVDHCCEALEQTGRTTLARHEHRVAEMVARSWTVSPGIEVNVRSGQPRW